MLITLVTTKRCENNSTANIITKMCQLSRHFPLRMPKTDLNGYAKCNLNVVFFCIPRLGDSAYIWETPG